MAHDAEVTALAHAFAAALEGRRAASEDDARWAFQALPVTVQNEMLADAAIVWQRLVFAAIAAAVEAERARVLGAFRDYLDELRAIYHAATAVGHVRNAIEQVERRFLGKPPAPACPHCVRGTVPMGTAACEECDGTGYSRPAPGAAEGATTLSRHAVPWDAESLARRFHEAYERLAPSFGYETRKASAVPWESVPEANRKLMIATCAAVFAPSSGRGGEGGERG